MKRWPVRKVSVTSEYGTRVTRFGKQPHYGIDLDGETGDDILAADSGRVIQIFEDNGIPYPTSCAKENKNRNGNGIIIDHGDGTFTGYSHLEAVAVELGEYVEKGEVIGTMGTTGCSSGSHLHFTVHVGHGNRVNPRDHLPRPGRKWEVIVLPEMTVRAGGRRGAGVSTVVTIVSLIAIAAAAMAALED